MTSLNQKGKIRKKHIFQTPNLHCKVSLRVRKLDEILDQILYHNLATKMLQDRPFK